MFFKMAIVSYRAPSPTALGLGEQRADSLPFLPLNPLLFPHSLWKVENAKLPNAISHAKMKLKYGWGALVTTRSQGCRQLNLGKARVDGLSVIKLVLHGF